MFKNYLRVAFRNLAKHKGYAFINITGLAAGIACCLMMVVYIFHELSYDTFHAKADRIYRIKQTSSSAIRTEEVATSVFPLGPTIVSEYPRLVENSVRFFNLQDDKNAILNREEKISFIESDFYFVDSTFFDLFSVNLIRGNPDKALANPLSLVITEEKAKRYFGDKDPIGKALSFNGIPKIDLVVTGIMEPIPGNSHMKADMLASFSSLDKLYYRNLDYDISWIWNPVWTYVLLREGVSAAELESRLPSFVDKYFMSYPGRLKSESVELGLQPVTDIHLYSDLISEIQPNSSILYIYLFATVAGLILIIACINFINLDTARAVERSREVGMRKVLGAGRWQLLKQFMGESFLMSFFAVALGVLMVQGLFPLFNGLVGRQLAFPLQDVWVIPGLILLIIAVGLLAGLYPALYLSGFQPVRVLKGGAAKGGKGALFRKVLVTFQFVLSVILILGTAIVYLQLRHMQTKELGFDKNHVVILPIEQNLIAWEFDTFKEEVLRNPNILSVTGISKVLGSDEQYYYLYSPGNATEDDETMNLVLFTTDDFIETFDIKVLAGRSFSRDFLTDQDKAVLVNKQMLKLLDVETPEEALGKIIRHNPTRSEDEFYSIIGVVDDFNYTSIKREVDPLIIRLVRDLRGILLNIEYAAIEIAPGGISPALKHIKNIWEKINYVDPFNYSFQDGELARIYASETKMSNMVSAFSVLCIFIACLGLFGLASFTSSKRTREIGIRKTMGASVSGILLLLSKEYFKLVLISNIIAWPVVYYLANRWLQDFPYRISMGWNLVMVCVVTAVLSMFICLLTVCYQSMKAALINPVDAIRDE